MRKRHMSIFPARAVPAKIDSRAPAHLLLLASENQIPRKALANSQTAGEGAAEIRENS